MLANEPRCYCGSTMKLHEGKYGKFYGCITWPKCEGTAALHSDGSLKSTPADKQTKAARIRAHETFDCLWKGGKLSRSEAYTWMADKMGLPTELAHIGFMDEEQCEALIQLVTKSMVANQEDNIPEAINGGKYQSDCVE